MAAAGLFGLLIGSFLNVVIYRVPRKKSVVSPPSACGSCGHPIRGHDNIPIISWLALRGRCRDCASPIAARYPLVELGTGVFFALVAWWALAGDVDSTTASWVSTGLTTAAFLYFAAISIVLTFIDCETHTLPNTIVLPAYLVGAALLGAASMTNGSYPALLSAVIGGAAMFLVYLLMAVLYPGGMGFGDVKLAGVIGLFLGWLGWDVLAVGAMAAFVFGGLFAIGLLAVGKASGKTSVPFGPWMLSGAWLGILAGPQIASGYLVFFGLGES